MYDYSMASITKKNDPWQTLLLCMRNANEIDGKFKIVWQQYLGRPGRYDQCHDTRLLAGRGYASNPKRLVIVEFGAPAALNDLAKRLDLSEHIDRHCA
jgi:hypothetical protein